MAFGYEGDATPDTLSLKGTGAFAFDDPERGGTPMVPLQDVALRPEDAANIYHVEPGEFFTDPKTGERHRYADKIPPWSTARPGYVDVYDPSHPPDVPSGRLGRAPGAAPDFSGLRDSPEPSEDVPQQDTETPIAKLKRKFPEMSKWSDEDIQGKMQQWFPSVPKDRLAVYSHQPGGSQLIQQYQERGKTPLEKFRDLYPQKATGDTEKDLQYMHDWLEPDTPMIQFKAKANPPNPVLQGLANLVLAIDQAGVAASDPAKAFGLNRAYEHGVIANLQAGAGQITEYPKDVTDVINRVNQAVGVYGWTQSASNWLEKNVPAYAGANGLFRNFINYLAGSAKQLQASAAKEEAMIPPDPLSQTSGTLGGAVGALPGGTFSWLLGGTGKAAMIYGMLTEATSAAGHAIETGQKNALMQGVPAAGFRGFMQYMLETNKGRLVFGITSGIASVADEEIEKFIRGEPNDITKDGKHFLINTLFALLIGGHKSAAPRPVTELSLEDTSKPLDPSQFRRSALMEETYDRPPEELEAEFRQTGEPIEVTQREVPQDFGPEVGPLTLAQGRARSALMGKTGSESLEELGRTVTQGEVSVPEPESGLTTMPQSYGLEWHFNNHAPEVREELDQALEAHQNGDTDKAAAHLDKAYVFMPDEQKRDHAAKFIGKVDELAGDKTPLGDYMYSGVPIRPRETKAERDRFNDYYFGGIPFPTKAIKDWFKEQTEDIRRIPGYVRPGAGSEMKRAAQQTIVQKTTEAAQMRTLLPTAVSRKYGVVDAFKKMQGILYGDQAQVQRRYINTRSDGQQIQDIIDYESGKPIKDKLTNYLYENMHRPLMSSLLDYLQRKGVDVHALHNYVMHNWITNEELPRLEAAWKQRGINPSITKPRQMPLKTGIALGFKMRSYNIVDIDRVYHIAVDHVARKIDVMQEWENQGYAWESTRKDIPRQYQNDKFLVPLQNGKSYFIHPDLINLWNNAFDAKSMFDSANPLARLFFKSLGLIKPLVAWKVSFALYHPLHITQITSADIMNNAAWKMAHGVGNWSDAIDLAIGSVPYAGDIYHTAKQAIRYRDPVAYLQGQRGVEFKDLTSDEQQSVSIAKDIGIDVSYNHQRSLNFSRFIERNLPMWEKQDPTGMVRMGARVLDLASNGFNRWWFGEVTPRLKLASAVMRHETLMREQPDLFKPANAQKLKAEYGKIHRDIEGRYGEMSYENLFQPRWLKQLGTTHLLSYGWQLGMFRVMGDGIIDTTTNAAHWGKLVQEAKARGRGLPVDKLFNERLSYLAMYGTKMLMAGWAISTLIGGKKPVFGNKADELSWWDGIFPLVGHDATGREKRVGMQYFFKEIPSYMQYGRMADDWIGPVSPSALTHLFESKLSPMIQGIGGALYNRDYMGKSIGTLPDRIWYLLNQGATPISVANMALPGQTTGDKIMSFMGFSPSARWTMRSDMENKVMSQYVAQRNKPTVEARDEYRQAFLNHDQAAMKAAHDKLVALKVPEKSIKKIQKDADVPSAMKLFKTLPADEQLEDLRRLSPEERAKWLPHASKAVKHQILAGSTH